MIYQTLVPFLGHPDANGLIRLRCRSLRYNSRLMGASQRYNHLQFLLSHYDTGWSGEVQ
jgi:hypothetical protein